MNKKHRLLRGAFLLSSPAGEVVNRFTLIRKTVWGNHFWSPGWCVDTVGVNGEMIRRYVRHQEKMAQTHQQQMEWLAW
uniref:transposase n=1 Tax=Erwinia psidii TaxID=69224 RepID=UPI00397BED15